MKRKLQLALAVALAIGVSQVGTTAFADNSALGVDPIFPESQIDPKTGYYDLNVQPGQQQDLQMTLMNGGSKPLRVHISANPASTNDNGVIEYGKNKIKVDSSLKANVGKMITLPKEVTIPANSTTTVTAKLAVQPEHFDGIAVGGLSFVTDPDKGQQKATGVQIRNRYAYNIGVVLHESPDTVKPNLHIHQVRAALVNYHTAVLARLQNDKPSFITGMNSHAIVYNAKTHKRILTEDKKDQKVAPNSHFDYTMMFADGQKLAPGKYVADINLKANEGHWHFKQSFDVSGQKAHAINKQNVTVSHFAWWQTLLLLLAFLLLVLLITYLVRRNRKQAAELRRLKNGVREVSDNEKN
ncbi:DUF916 and DUF3324 domain-containing protein [Weissella confusa]|uniref:DUF916 and DUF3324 domain-containing protein n=1 Tax=Weissella fermenti TaxID=2987699 RepID=A0ABT6D3Z9_9LACO|nr:MULTISPECIES: DUF916 and DUF3324 domain-containing protein [Weissella]MBJ7688150.1 DUF916 and DUF3324 domain-containing protein [Weissella confusa]MCW0926195.1 DUF916 and DUF3324 domain-containing protein [Weissella sp. LMG 11983]MDF9300253.1 DUF916 and DUF3324 domain-containing protein [Weissella sp. BK2]